MRIFYANAGGGYKIDSGEYGLAAPRGIGHNRVMNDRDIPVRVTKLSEQGRETDLRDTTVEERFAMMWQLALDALALAGEPVVEPRLPRHVVRVVRLSDK